MKKQIEKLADKMDQSAENYNAHDFVITHRALAVLCWETIGCDATLKLFVALRKQHGLPGLTGVAGIGPARSFLARRKIAEDWADWHLPEKGAA